MKELINGFLIKVEGMGFKEGTCGEGHWVYN